MNNRYGELDSLRGIAALMVLIGHFVYVLPLINEGVRPYLAILTSGHSAVILFFILSGFVLSLPFYKNTKFNYFMYLIKRFCRIYIPYISILFIALVVKNILYSKIGTIPDISDWGNWNIKISFNNTMNHILFLGEYKWDTFNMVIWTLIHEMRISIVFPLIIILVLKVNWKINIGVGILLSYVGYLLMKIIPSEFNTPLSTNYFITLHYVAMFIIGAMLAKNKDYLLKKLDILKVKYLFLPLGILFFCYPRIPFTLLSKLIGETDYSLYLIIIDWYITFGAILIILSALSSNLFSKFLLMKPIHYLGEISYSIYLTHAVVLLSTVHILYGIIPLPLILLISFIFTMLCSILCNMFIEKPSIKLGKYLTRPKETSEVSAIVIKV